MTLDQWRAIVASRPLARTIDELRAATAFFSPLLNGSATGALPRVGKVSKHVVRVAIGAASELALEVIEPEPDNTTEPIDGLPICVFVHGGGWVAGSVESYRSLTHNLVSASRRVGPGTIVVAVDYGLAPEHPPDAIVDDVMQSVRWACLHANKFGGDPARVVLVGDSAGAQLAVIAAARMREEVDVRGLALLYGVLDFERLDAPELRGILQMRGWFLGEHDAERAARARFDPVMNVRGLPRVMVVSAAEDALAPQSEAFVAAARAASVEVDASVVAGVPHGFLQCGLWPRTAETLEAVAQFINETTSENNRSSMRR